MECQYCRKQDCFGTCLADNANANADRELAHVAARLEVAMEDDLQELGMAMQANDGYYSQ